MVITGFEYLIRDRNENITELAKKLEIDIKVLNKWMFSPQNIPKAKLAVLAKYFDTHERFIINKFEIKIDKKQILEDRDFKKEVIFENFDKIIGSMRKDK